MTRFAVVIASFMWLSDSAFAAPRHAIYVNGKLVNASDTQTAHALSRCVDRYRSATTQIDILSQDEKRAAFAYLQFTVDKETATEMTSMVMTSNVRFVSAPERSIQSECIGCGSQPVRRLFHDVIEKTLFTGTRALYKPLAVTACQAAGVETVTVTVARTANGIGLEHGIHYGLRLLPAADETGVTLVRDTTATDELTSTFKLSGPTKPQARFISACRTGTAQAYVLVPHGRLPGDTTKVNEDATD